MKIVKHAMLVALVACAPLSLHGGWWWNFKYELSHKTKKIRAVPGDAKRWVGRKILRLRFNSTVKKLFYTIVQDIQDVARTGEPKAGGLKERDFWWKVYKTRTESGEEEVRVASWNEKEFKHFGFYDYEFSVPRADVDVQEDWKFSVKTALLYHFKFWLKKPDIVLRRVSAAMR